MTISQSDADLKNHLKDQIGFLQRSAESFDAGYTSEAKRIAVILRILLYDSNGCTSLLKQLSKKNIKFFNTSSTYSGGLVSTMRLVNIGSIVKDGKNTVFYNAPLDNRPPSVNVNQRTDFDEWWNETVIIDQKFNKFSRADLILKVCNKDGGAHIDPKLNNAYAALTRFNSLGFLSVDSEGEKPLTSPELANIRQICHEVLKTFRVEFPELFS